MGRAYRELELAGLVGGRGRAGTRVRVPPASTNRTTELASAAHRFAVRARQLGVEADEAARLVKHAMQRLPTTDARG